MGETSFKLALILFNIIFIAFLTAIIVFIAQYKKKKRQYTDELKNRELFHKKELLKTKMEIQEQTMKYIGREIHDNVGQKLTLSSLYLQQMISEKSSLEMSEDLIGINTIIGDSLNELRQLSKSLIDDTILTKSTLELIELECEKVRKLKKYTIKFRHDKKLPTLSYYKKGLLLRIVQEFLTNSFKHSKCKELIIKISSKDNALNVSLKDDGVGFNTETIKTKGVGLKNIRKRIEIINGSFSLKSKKGNGTQLLIRIPIK